MDRFSSDIPCDLKLIRAQRWCLSSLPTFLFVCVCVWKRQRRHRRLLQPLLADNNNNIFRSAFMVRISKCEILNGPSTYHATTPLRLNRMSVNGSASSDNSSTPPPEYTSSIMILGITYTARSNGNASLAMPSILHGWRSVVRSHHLLSIIFFILLFSRVHTRTLLAYYTQALPYTQTYTTNGQDQCNYSTGMYLTVAERRAHGHPMHTK